LHDPSLGVFEDYGRLFDAQSVRERLLRLVYSQMRWVFAFYFIVVVVVVIDVVIDVFG